MLLRMCQVCLRFNGYTERSTTGMQENLYNYKYTNLKFLHVFI